MQFMMHAVFVVGFKVTFLDSAVGGAAVGGGGMKHFVWQFATCALQDIMQLVVVDVSGV